MIKPHVSILIICTGNLCRSPMAEAMLRRQAEQSGAPLQVASAGFATEGEAPPEPTLAVMRRRGIDLSEHRSRLLTPSMLATADLVIGMTRTHVWEAAVRDPDIVPRAFVLGELVRLNDDIGHRSTGEPFERWTERLHVERRHGAHAPLSGDEIPDPFGKRRKVHERVASRIEQLVLQLPDCAFEPVRAFSTIRWHEGKLAWPPGSSRTADQ